MIFGAHVVLFSKDAEADRAFLRDVFGLGAVDAGGGWLICALPPAEAAVHPADNNDRRQLYFMCGNLNDAMLGLRAKGVRCSTVQEAEWGSVTEITLPGGGAIGLYQPKHPTAISRPRTPRPTRRPNRRRVARRN